MWPLLLLNLNPGYHVRGGGAARCTGNTFIDVHNTGPPLPLQKPNTHAIHFGVSTRVSTLAACDV